MEDCRHFGAGGEVDADLMRLFPVRRNLQDCGAAQAAMRDQHLFAEPLSVTRGDDFGGNAGQVAVAGAVVCFEYEWNESRSRLADFEIKLPGEVVAKRGCADFWNRQAAGRTH